MVRHDGTSAAALTLKKKLARVLLQCVYIKKNESDSVRCEAQPLGNQNKHCERSV